MAILVDSLANLDNTVRRKFKKVFSRLGDEFVVRTPMQEGDAVADLLIEGPGNAWLLLGCHESKPSSTELNKYMSFSLILDKSYQVRISYLALTQVGESIFDEVGSAVPALEIIEQQQFFEDGENLVQQYLTRVPESAHSWIKKTLFPETKINPECTTRREVIYRDNTAQLKPYFLDYDQESAAKLDMIREPLTDEEGEDEDKHFVRLINGVAGCGKTLILINRTILYCKKYPHKKVLFLIHNKPITTDIKYKFKHYLEGKPGNLNICTFHSFALSQQIKAKEWVNPLFNAKDLKPVKEKILGKNNEKRNELNLSDNQLWSEIEFINDYLIVDKNEYMEYERQGRGFALQKTQREVVWYLYEQAMALASNKKGYLPSLYIRELCLDDGIANELDKYDHVLLDEAQFFSPSWLQLVLKSINENGQLFMCADPNQGFLKSRLSWKSVGLNVRGRTKKLNYSYRTTYEILVAANALLEHLNDDPDDFIKPDLKNMERGSKPRIIYTDTPQDELKRFLNELKETVDNENLPLHQVMVLCGDSLSPWKLKSSMEGVVGKNTVVNCNYKKDLEENFGARIKLMSINSCTGMESGITFVLGVGGILISENNLDLSEEEKEEQHQESIRKLYVAMTRAGQKLVLFSTETLPAYVEQYMETS